MDTWATCYFFQFKEFARMSVGGGNGLLLSCSILSVLYFTDLIDTSPQLDQRISPLFSFPSTPFGDIPSKKPVPKKKVYYTQLHDGSSKWGHSAPQIKIHWHGFSKVLEQTTRIFRSYCCTDTQIFNGIPRVLPRSSMTVFLEKWLAVLRQHFLAYSTFISY